MRVVSDLRAEQPERARIVEALDLLASAQAHDTVVVFLASHGVSDATGEYFFVPRDARPEDLVRAAHGHGADAPSLIRWSVFFDALRRAAGRRVARGRHLSRAWRRRDDPTCNRSAKRSAAARFLASARVGAAENRRSTRRRGTRCSRMRCSRSARRRRRRPRRCRDPVRGVPVCCAYGRALARLEDRALRHRNCSPRSRSATPCSPARRRERPAYLAPARLTALTRSADAVPQVRHHADPLHVPLRIDLAQRVDARVWFPSRWRMSWGRIEPPAVACR